MDKSFKELIGPLNSIRGSNGPISSLSMTNGPSTITDAKPLFTTTTGTSEQGLTVTVTTLLHTANIATISDQIFTHLPTLLSNSTSRTTRERNNKNALHYFLIATPGGTAASRPKVYEYHLWLTRPIDKTYKGGIEATEQIESIVTDPTDQPSLTRSLGKQRLELLSLRRELTDAKHIVSNKFKCKSLEGRVKRLEASIEELEKLEKLEELAAKKTSKVESNIGSETATHTITLASYSDVSMKDFEVSQSERGEEEWEASTRSECTTINRIAYKRSVDTRARTRSHTPGEHTPRMCGDVSGRFCSLRRPLTAPFRPRRSPFVRCASPSIHTCVWAPCPMLFGFPKRATSGSKRAICYQILCSLVITSEPEVHVCGTNPLLLSLLPQSQIYNHAIKTTRKTSRTMPVPTTLNGTITLTPAAHECTTMSIKLTMQYTPPTKTHASGTGTGAWGSTFGSQIASLANNASTHLGTSASTALGTVSPRNTLPPSPTLATNLLANITAITSHLHQHYSSYDHVDHVAYTNFAANIDTCPPPLPHETSLLNTSVYYTSPPTKNLPHSLASHNTVTTSYRASEEKEGAVWGKAVAKIDAAAAQVLAYLFCLDAPGRNAAYVREGGGFRLVERVGLRSVLCCWEDSSSTRNTGRNTALGVHGVWCVWRKEADGAACGSYTLAVAPIEVYPVEDEAKERMTDMVREHVIKNKMGGSSSFKSTSFSSSFSAGTKRAAGTTGGRRGVWRIRPVADNVSEVTYVAQKGFASKDLPLKAMKMKINTALVTVDKLQDRFERNGKLVDEEIRKATDVMESPSLDELKPKDETRGIFLMCQAISGDDCSERASFMEMQTSQNRTKRGNASAALSTSRGTSRGTMATVRSTKKVASMMIRSVLGLRATDSDWVDLPSPSPFVTLGMKFLARPPESPDHDIPIILARGEVVVDCSLDDAYAWMLFNTSRERTKTAYERGDLAHVEVKADTFYDMTTATIRKMPWRLTNRGNSRVLL